jgi:D-xylose 1-dehydrogenase
LSGSEYPPSRSLARLLRSSLPAIPGQLYQGARTMSQSATYPDLASRSVLLSGGGSGIGAQIVRRFCGQGSKVAFVDIDRGHSEELVAALTGEGLPPPLFLPCDLRDIDALRTCVASAGEANGPITVLVNNAARDDRHPFDTVTPEYWDERFAVNLKHQFFAAQAVYPMMDWTCMIAFSGL